MCQCDIYRENQNFGFEHGHTTYFSNHMQHIEK